MGQTSYYANWFFPSCGGFSELNAGRQVLPTKEGVNRAQQKIIQLQRAFDATCVIDPEEK